MAKIRFLYLVELTGKGKRVYERVRSHAKKWVLICEANKKALNKAKNNWRSIAVIIISSLYTHKIIFLLENAKNTHTHTDTGYSSFVIKLCAKINEPGLHSMRNEHNKNKNEQKTMKQNNKSENEKKECRTAKHEKKRCDVRENNNLYYTHGME